MNYWKGLLIAVAIDTALIAGCQFLATEPVPPAEQTLSIDELNALDSQIDSLMMHLQEHPTDVDAMQALARLYADHGWAEQAIGPLARALELDPYRRNLWAALDRAVEKTGRVEITDAELVRAALDFVESVETYGHGC